MRLAWIVLLVTTVGCLGPSAPTTTVAANPTPPGATAALNNTSVVEAPVWKLGDAWDVTAKGFGPATRSTLVVTSASSDGYVVSTTDPTLAAYDAMYDISYLGRIRAADLAGSQHDKAIVFFQFPLKDGASWSTVWDGIPMGVVATWSPAIATAGGAPGFTLVASANGKPYVTYDYVPALKWWSHLDFSAGYGFGVDRRVENWTGAIATATAKEVFNSTTAVPVATFNTQTFHVDDRQSWIQVDLSGGAKTYARAYQLVDPNGTAYPQGGPAYEAQPSGGFVYSSAQYPALAGDWKVSAPEAHTNDGYFAMSVHEVAVAMRPFA